MDPSVAALLDELHSSGAEYDAGKSDRLERLRNVEPVTGALLAVLVRALGARRILEIGGSNGYSTIWLAAAARDVGGTVTSLELDPARTAMARENLARAGLLDHVELVTADAAAVLAEAEAEAYDLVFLDAERDAYPGYWADLLRVLAPGGLIAADNAISHEAEMAPFKRILEDDSRVEHALDATGAGVLFAVRACSPGTARP